MSRPRVDPALAARLLAAAPARLRRRLDESPRMAEGWSWDADGVTVDADTRVTLRGAELHGDDQLRCTCLLSPRCLHVLACLALLEPLEAAIPTTPAAVAPPTGPLDPELRVAATAGLEAVGTLLGCGARAGGAVVQADLMRALHGARVAGCHRLGAALARLLGGVRRLRGGDPASDANEVLADAAEACAAALALLASDAVPAAAGVARRAYETVGNLRLHGLCAEPVLTNGGWAGVVTWLADAQGRLWSLGDVQPGDAARVLQAWRGGVRLGDLSLAHAELARGGALVQDATASPEGRLGSGSAVQAVRAAGARWDEAPLATLFARPLTAQIDAAFADGRPGLLTLRGRLDGVVLRLPDGPGLLLQPPSWDRALPAAANLRALAACAGAEICVVVRPLREAAGQAVLLALSPGGDGLRLPAALGDRLMVGLEHLPQAGLSGDAPSPPLLASDPLPWAALHRRALAVLLGGRSALPAALVASIAGEAGALRQRLCPAAADRLGALFQACQSAPGGSWGRVRQTAPEAFARAWAGAALHAAEARRHAMHEAWRRWAS
jgi:hypothetical protein